MPVFTPNMINQIANALRGLTTNFYERTPLILTGDEFIAAFIDPTHVDKLKEVQTLVGFIGQTNMSSVIGDSQGHQLDISVRFNGTSPIVLPQYVGRGVQPTCPSELTDKIVGWADDRNRFGEAFGDICDALYHLNSSVGDAAALALVLPCLSTIMGQVSSDSDNATVKRARKLTDVKSFGKLPKLSVQVKQRLIEASAIVNSVTLMLGAECPTTKAHDALIYVTGRKSYQATANLFYRDSPANTPVPVATFI